MTQPTQKKVKMRKIVVLDDGDGTTWATNALIVEVPESLLDELQNDSKAVRDFMKGPSVFDLEVEREMARLALRDLVEQLGTDKVDLRPYRPEMASALQQAKTVLRKLERQAAQAEEEAAKNPTSAEPSDFQYADKVDHVRHYKGDTYMRSAEDIEWAREGCLFNIGKYMFRLGQKEGVPPRQECEKALWYTRRLVENEFYGRPLRMKEMKTLEAARGHGEEHLDASQMEEAKPVLDEIFRLLWL